MKESALRDLIAQHIYKLKPGLTLLQKEQYIPGEHGTKSFIDLYAKDERGRHVLIELKRSATASRQAIHEVNKYAERVKQYFGAKDSEIHVIIASTEWTELLLPFSRFYADAGFSIEGLRIDVSEDNLDFHAQPVSPLPIVQGRFIAPWHNIYWYADNDSFQKGIASIEEAYRQKGIVDYVIVKLYLPNRSTPDERRAALQAQVANLLNVAEPTLAGSFTNISIPVYEYVAYTALQILPKSKCMEIISRDEDEMENVQEILPHMEENEALRYLHESIESVDPFPQCNYYEIGSPAKFSKLLDLANCTVLGIIRHGIFLRNIVLTDDIICSELEAKDGSTGQKLKRNVGMQNLAQVTNLKEDIATTLESNPVWRNHILQIIEDIKSEFPDSTIDINVFNPGTGIFTIYYAVTKEAGFLYLPSYYILVKNPDAARLYFGALEASGSAITFPQLLQKYYGGCMTALLTTVTWGGSDERDSDIIEDLGAQYCSYRSDLLNNAAADFFALHDGKWRPCKTISLNGMFAEYVEKNQALVNQIILKLRPYDKGALFDFSNTDLYLEKYVDMVTAKKRNIYYAGAPDVCDICGFPLSDERFMVDGAVRGSSVWANMCASCFCAYGVKIGWGDGQLYKREAGKWLLVGGFCPDAE